MRDFECVTRAACVKKEEEEEEEEIAPFSIRVVCRLFFWQNECLLSGF